MNAWWTGCLAIMRLNGYDRLNLSRMAVIGIVLSLLASLSIWRIAVVGWRWWSGPIVSHKRLFRALCDQHGLNTEQRHLMQRIADEGAFDPNFLFIDPNLWFTSQVVSADGTPRTELHRKLFGRESPGCEMAGELVEHRF